MTYICPSTRNENKIKIREWKFENTELVLYIRVLEVFEYVMHGICTVHV